MPSRLRKKHQQSETGCVFSTWSSAAHQFPVSKEKPAACISNSRAGRAVCSWFYDEYFFPVNAMCLLWFQAPKTSSVLRFSHSRESKCVYSRVTRLLSLSIALTWVFSLVSALGTNTATTHTTARRPIIMAASTTKVTIFFTATRIGSCPFLKSASNVYRDTYRETAAGVEPLPLSLNLHVACGEDSPRCNRRDPCSAGPRDRCCM